MQKEVLKRTKMPKIRKLWQKNSDVTKLKKWNLNPKGLGAAIIAPRRYHQHLGTAVKFLGHIFWAVLKSIKIILLYRTEGAPINTIFLILLREDSGHIGGKTTKREIQKKNSKRITPSNWRFEALIGKGRRSLYKNSTFSYTSLLQIWWCILRQLIIFFLHYE